MRRQSAAPFPLSRHFGGAISGGEIHLLRRLGVKVLLNSLVAVGG